MHLSPFKNNPKGRDCAQSGHTAALAFNASKFAGTAGINWF